MRAGYQSFWGPGRHKFGSNWFWYFNSPLGCHVEYDADMDHTTTNGLRAKPRWDQRARRRFCSSTASTGRRAVRLPARRGPATDDPTNRTDRRSSRGGSARFRAFDGSRIKAFAVRRNGCLYAYWDARTTAPDPAIVRPGGFCGWYEPYTQSEAFVVTEVNGRWGKAQPVAGISVLGHQQEANVTSLSCASPGNCAAGGYYLPRHSRRRRSHSSPARSTARGRRRDQSPASPPRPTRAGSRQCPAPPRKPPRPGRRG